MSPTMTGLKVLYMTPQPRLPERLTRATFMDEEIRSLAAAGIQAYVLSAVAPSDSRSGLVSVKSVRARATVTNRVRAARLLARPVRGMPVPNWADPKLWYRSGWLEHVAAQIVREEGIDLVHSHFAWPNGQGGAIVRALTGRPLVATLRGNDVLMKPEIKYGARHAPTFDRAVRGLLRSAERTLYFSEMMRDAGIQLGARPESTVVLRKGVDTEHFTPVADRAALRRELGLPDRPVVLTVAGLIERKGVHHLLEAMALLRDDRDFTLVVIGSGPERDRLTARGAQLGLSDRIVFTGRVDRQTIPKYFAACEAFVLASIVEAAGNVVLEAMSAARPVVCTDSGGPGEFVKHGTTGFVVPVGDIHAIAARVGLLLGNAALADELGAQGRRRAMTEFRYESMTAAIIDVYRDVLRDSPASTRRRSLERTAARVAL